MSSTRKKSNKKNFSRAKKRKFFGNRYTKIGEGQTMTSSASERKLGDINTLNEADNIDAGSSYFCLVDFSILKTLFAELNCPECNGAVELYDESSSMMGLSHFLLFLVNVVSGKRHHIHLKSAIAKKINLEESLLKAMSDWSLLFVKWVKVTLGLKRFLES